MTDINNELFRRTAPKKKLEIIEKLTESELLRVTQDTLFRIVKEVGTGKKGSPNKSVRLRFNVGNDWNSDVEEIYVWKKKLYVDFYLQYSNTDTNTEDSWGNFMCSGDYRGDYEYEDRYGGKQTTYFTYYKEDKAKVIKAILKTYIYDKYPKEKLS